MTREVWITGIGCVSALGEGEAAQFAALAEGGVKPEWMDSASLAPFTVHPIKTIDLNRYIPKKGDQRAMGPLMHYGVYAAGMALEDAGMAGNEELLSRTHLIVGCGGGERDVAVDELVMKKLPTANDPGALLNEILQTELRPTLFLAQLPNLFAGNISIVHGVTGSSRTFMGEEMAGADAVLIAFERLSAGQGDIFLVGSAFSADRPDEMATFAPAGYLGRGPVEPLWSAKRNGMNFGSMGAFIVLEAREHAEARGAKPAARLFTVATERSDRRPGAATFTALGQWNAIRPRLAPEPIAVLSGATGVAAPTREEYAFLEGLEHPHAVRGTAAAVGHGLESAFVYNLVLAAAVARRRRLFAPLSDDRAIEAPLDTPVSQVLVTQWGHQRGEAMALVEAVSENGES